MRSGQQLFGTGERKPFNTRIEESRKTENGDCRVVLELYNATKPLSPAIMHKPNKRRKYHLKRSILLVFVFFAFMILAGSCAPAAASVPPASEPEIPLCPPTLDMYGDIPAIQGTVMEVTSFGPPLELKNTDLAIRLVDVYYSGIIVAANVVRPAEGEVQELYINETKIELASTDISSGCISTVEFGSMPILFDANLMGGSSALVMTPGQIEKLNLP